MGEGSNAPIDTCYHNDLEPAERNDTSDSDKCLNQLLEQQWLVPNLEGDDDESTPIEVDRCRKILEDGYLINGEGKIELPCLWKPGHPDFNSNFEQAKRRLQSTLNSKAMNKPGARKQYGDIFKRYASDGIISRVYDKNPRRKGTYYWAHFPVLREDKLTTKVRIVFDGAAVYDRHSINDYLYAGPLLINDLVDVLLRFRKHKHVVLSDIKEMFLQLSMAPKDRPYHRFLWEDENGELIIYEFNRHLFGKKDSPSLSLYGLRITALKNIDKYPLVHQTLEKSSMMDDMIASLADKQMAIELVKQLIAFFDKECGMRLCKFITNDDDILTSISTDRRHPLMADLTTLQGSQLVTKVLGVTWNITEDFLSLQIPPVPNPKSWTKRKILSYLHSIFDVSNFWLPIMLPAKVILQECWKCQTEWDCAVPPELEDRWKTWLQNLEKSPLPKVKRLLMPDPDKPASLHVFTDASVEAYAASGFLVQGDSSTFVMARGKVASVANAHTVPRMELLGLELGSALMVKLQRALEIDRKDCYLWTDSKTCFDWMRVEHRALQAFVKNRILKVTNRVNVDNIKWVDGVSNPADVATRIVPLEREQMDLWFQGPSFLTKPDLWPALPPAQVITPTDDSWKELRTELKKDKEEYEIPGTFSCLSPRMTMYEENDKVESVACFATMGCFATARAKAKKPKKAKAKAAKKKPKKAAEKITNRTKVLDDYLKSKPLSRVRVRVGPKVPWEFSKEEQSKVDKFLWLQTTSNLVRAERQAATVVKFVEWLKAKRPQKFCSWPLPPADLKKGTALLIRLTQKDSFAPLLKTMGRPGFRFADEMARLRPFVDKDGILRVGGRLQTVSHLEFEARCPVLLRADSLLAKRVFDYVHQEVLCHVGGFRGMLGNLGLTYWVIGGPRAMKGVVKRCVLCRRKERRPLEQLMGQLPSTRVPSEKRMVPFATATMCDAFGPVVTKGGRVTRASPTGGATKRWGLVFRCCLTGAVHLEVLMDSSCDSFLMALQRFLTFRCKPDIIYLDNQSNFTCAEKEIQRIVLEQEQRLVQPLEKAALDVDQRIQGHKGIEFRFGPPFGPHHQGGVERYVGLVKRALFSVLGRHAPTDYELSSVLYKVAALLNNMPIAYTHVSADASAIEAEPITPAHFLMGQPFSNILDGEFDPSDFTENLHALNKVLDKFWAQFRSEMMRKLHTYSKWTQVRDSVAVGDIVVVLEDGEGPHFPLGRILEVLRGKDGLVRRVEVKIGYNVYERPITRLVAVLGPREEEMAPDSAVKEAAPKATADKPVDD